MTLPLSKNSSALNSSTWFSRALACTRVNTELGLAVGSPVMSSQVVGRPGVSNSPAVWAAVNDRVPRPTLITVPVPPAVAVSSAAPFKVRAVVNCTAAPVGLLEDAGLGHTVCEERVRRGGEGARAGDRKSVV